MKIKELSKKMGIEIVTSEVPNNADGTFSGVIRAIGTGWVNSGTYHLLASGSITGGSYDQLFSFSSQSSSADNNPDQNKGKTCFLFWCW